MFSALLLKKFTDLMAFFISDRGALPRAWGVGNFLKRLGVTLFTRSSVHCADKMTAINNSKAFLWVINVQVSCYRESRIW